MEGLREVIQPDFSWYRAISRAHGVSPRCPFASVHRCPRYYQSVSLLGRFGHTAISDQQDSELLNRWKQSDVWPVVDEQAVSIIATDGQAKIFSNFCPEVAYDRFGMFADSFSRVGDELDHSLRHQQLSREGAHSTDYRWNWTFASPLHYTECPVYSLLSTPQESHGQRAASSSPTVSTSFSTESPVGYVDQVHTAPGTFISYSWDDETHRAWVRELASRLRADGIDVVLDQWHAAPGDQLPQFMERSIRDNQFVLIICTPGYKRRADGRRGGVGYEGDIITGEVVTTRNHRKFIPVLRSGDWASASASWLAGKYFVDLRGDPYSEAQYADLVATLHGDREKAPPVGIRKPQPRATATVTPAGSQSAPPPAAPIELPIRITGIIADEVTVPTMDGTPGSGLYDIPFRLSRRPSSDWSDLFVQVWDHPPRWTLMHRPGIASVEGDKVWLRGTSLHEVERYHRETVKLAVNEANRLCEEATQRQDAQNRAEAERTRRHRESIQDAASRLDFD